jgi:hypothetical protein
MLSLWPDGLFAGNARRGSNVSPLFPGGGITFGPKPRDWSIKMNKKERRLALATALQVGMPNEWHGPPHRSSFDFLASTYDNVRKA